MAKSGDNGGESGGSGNGRGPRWGRDLLFALAAVVVIVPVVVFFAARTAAFREWLQTELREKTGLPGLTISDSRIGWPYQLIVSDVAWTSTNEASLAGFKADEVRIGIGRGGGVSLKLSNCILTMERQKDGTWLPACCSRLGELRDISQSGIAMGGLRGKVLIEVFRGSIYWLDCSGNQLFAVQDFDFAIAPLENGRGRDFHYCTFSAYEITQRDGASSRDVKSEWLLLDDGRFVEIEYKTGVIPPPGAPGRRDGDDQ